MLSVLWPHDFLLVSHLSKLWMLSVLWPHDFRLVAMFKNEISEQYGQQYFLEEENYSPPCRRTYKIQRESIKILFFIDFTMGRRTRAKINRPSIQPSPGIQSIQTDHGKQVEDK